MQYSIHFCSQPIGETDDSGTNYFKEYQQGENIVHWDIIDSPVAEAFVYSTQLILNNTEHSPESPRNFIDWNRYGKHVDWNTWIIDADNLNRELDYCKSNNFIEFDDSYSIDIDLPVSERFDRLNRIHFAFEQALEDRQVQNTATPEFLASLERLNKLVHSLEKSPDSDFGESFYVIRHTSDHVRHQYPQLTSEMYQCFTNNTLCGDLFSDFFTVGKDLGHAFVTNDVELVKNREVKQQSVVSGAVAFALDQNNFGTAWDRKDPAEEQYYRWCIANSVRQYGYEYTDPKYNLGRAPVGKLTGHTFDSLKAVLSETPYVTKVELNV